MKRVFIIILASAIAFSLVACGSKPADSVGKTEDTTEAEKPAGMQNPMVEISDPAEFEKQLGVTIDPTQIMSDTKLFIIDKNLAHIAWTQKNVNNEDVNFTLRATKDTNLGPVCHGIQGELTKLNVIDVQGSDGTVKLTVSTQGEYTVYSWKKGDAYYSLTYDRDMSQMAMAEVLDQVMFATGTMTPVKTVFPLPSEVDPENIEDGIYTVYADEDGIYEDGGKYFMDCEIYTKEYFDTVELHSLKPGDAIVISGEYFSDIKKVEEKDGAIYINDGDPDNGGFRFRPADGGTYVFVDFDDYPSFTDHGMTTLEMADDAVLTDTSNLDKNCEKVVITGPKAIADYFVSSEYARLSPGAGTIRTENKKVVEINTWYTP